MDLRPPKGTTSYQGRGSRYDLVPHGNGRDILVLRSSTAAPGRVESSWIPREGGLARFVSDNGLTHKLPHRASLSRDVAIVAAHRLADARTETVAA